jgi:hypothetical protein
MKKTSTLTARSMKNAALTLFCCTVLMVFAARCASAQNQCSSALPVGTATGCGALITVYQVDSTGKATAFTVTTLGNGNPYDGTEDTLVGVQNNSSTNLSSIPLSSPNAPIFGFDGDGPCDTLYHSPAYSWCPEGYPTAPGDPNPEGYAGPDNTFTITNNTSGTVSFTTAIPNGESTWFALEGTPTSFGQISQTQPVFPGVTTIYPIGNDNHKITPFNNLGGELVTITAFLVPKASFVPPSNFPGESCIPYADFSGTTDTCVEVHQTCAQGSASSNDCDTFSYQVMTNYDLPADFPVTTIVGPDYLYVQNQSCPTTGTPAQSVFLSYSVTRTDPVTKGGLNPTNGCFVATYTPGAPVITGGTTATFEGFDSPVSDTALNIMKAGRAVPLQWVQLDNNGNPITNLSLCTAMNSSGGCTAPAGVSAPWLFVQAYSVNGSLCTQDTDGSVSLPTNAAGNSGLQYLGSTQPGLYQYNWKTPSGIPKGTCAEITFTYSSGAFFVTPAQFQFK